MRSRLIGTDGDDRDGAAGVLDDPWCHGAVDQLLEDGLAAVAEDEEIRTARRVDQLNIGEATTEQLMHRDRRVAARGQRGGLEEDRQLILVA